MASADFDSEESLDSFQSEPDEDEETEAKGKSFHNNTKGLEEKLKEILYDGDWIERLDTVCETDSINMPLGDGEEESATQSKSLQAKGNVHDDFKREMFFYCQAQVAAKTSLEKLKSLLIQTERPGDYFAEMVKTDAHMHKVREKLAAEKQGRENAEKVKKIRRMKQFGKKVQREVLQKRQEEKKKMLQAVNRIKKGKEKLNDVDGDLFNINTEKSKGKPQFEKSSKRKRKDSKYGFGGQKKKMKMNTSGSSGDMSGFKSSIHSKAPKGKGKPGKGKPKRLGKARRSQMKSKKR
eukprot:gene7817-8664_t